MRVLAIAVAIMMTAATAASAQESPARIAEGVARDVLTRDNLEAIYRAAVHALIDAKDGTSAFLPG